MKVGIDLNISDCTARRSLNRQGYMCLQTRKKGLMSRKEVEDRLVFGCKMKQQFPQNVWTTGITWHFICTQN